jgi:hypothetical protein
MNELNDEHSYNHILKVNLDADVGTITEAQIYDPNTEPKKSLYSKFLLLSVPGGLID